MAGGSGSGRHWRHGIGRGHGTAIGMVARGEALARRGAGRRVAHLDTEASGGAEPALQDCRRGPQGGHQSASVLGSIGMALWWSQKYKAVNNVCTTRSDGEPREQKENASCNGKGVKVKREKERRIRRENLSENDRGTRSRTKILYEFEKVNKPRG